MKSELNEVVIELLGLVVACVAMSVFLPTMGPYTPIRAVTENLSTGKRLAVAAKAFATDHEGHFPRHLIEFEPDYLPAGNSELYLFRSVDTDSNGNADLQRYDWLYFGAFFDEQHPPTILIAAPQAFTVRGKAKRIVALADGTATIVTEETFQEKLAATIAELNERAAALMPKQEQGTPPVERPAVP